MTALAKNGGIERWLVLTDGLGPRPRLRRLHEGRAPETRFAVEAYVNFVREKTLVEAVASSLTELFAPKIHKERISGMLENYDFISDEAMAYFSAAWTQAPDDAHFALDYVKRNARRRGAGRRPRCAALQVQRAVGAARCASLRLCRARAGPARRFRSGQIMSRNRSPCRLYRRTGDAAAFARPI